MGDWPATIHEVPHVFMDMTALDPNVTNDDSNGRSTVWANVSTGLGAIAHEMGHTFGLPHSPDPFSFMSRGFDFFSRTFTVKEAPSARGVGASTIKPDEHTRWDPYEAAQLNWNPYFQADPLVATSDEEPKITVDGDVVTLSAAAGIRVYGTDRDDTPAVFTEVKVGDAPKQVILSRKELRGKLGTDKVFRITVIDSAGRRVTIDDKP